MFRLKALVSVLALALLAPASAFGVDTGSADFSRYVAIGDSLTAGFTSGGLVETAQRNSYPALIWRQTTGQTAGFEQPLVTAPGIPALLQLTSLSPLVIAPASGRGNPANLNLQRPYNNLAVPGARVHNTVTTVTDNGGLHDLILRGLGTAVQQAVALRPTFATIWIGNNDVRAAATSGRVIEGVTLTPVASFEADFRALTAAIAGTGARMALANIPEVTSIPFVTTLSRFIVNPATNQPVLVNGNPVPLIGPNGPLGPNDRVLLTATAELQQGRGIPAALGGSGQPLSDAVVLDANEIATINARVQAFNGIIRAEATARNAALVDANALLRRLATTGISVGGVTFTSAFLTGGIFSYDGVHPTVFGYAFIANAFIDAINEQFDGEIPPVNLFPFMFGTSSAASSVTAAFEQDAEPAGTPLLTPEAIRNLFWALNVDTAPKKRPRGRR